MTKHRIDVYCDGRVLRDSPVPSHADKVARIIYFEFSEADKDGGHPDYWFTDKVPNAASSRVWDETSRRIDLEREAEGAKNYRGPLPAPPGTVARGLADRMRRDDRIRPQVESELGLTGRTGSHKTMEVVDEDGKVYDIGTIDPEAHVVHTKIIMRCPVCGLDLQRRQLALVPILDKLMDAGQHRVSLSALVRVLES